MRKLFKWLFRLIVVIAIGFFAMAILLTRNLFTYSTISFLSDKPFSASEQDDLRNTFEDSFLIKEEEGYTIFYPQSGLCLEEKSLVNSGAEQSIDVVFTISDNYAYIDMNKPITNARVVVTYFKSSILERVSFATKFYSWGI